MKFKYLETQKKSLSEKNYCWKNKNNTSKKKKKKKKEKKEKETGIKILTLNY